MEQTYKPEGSLLGTPDNIGSLSSLSAMERAASSRRICEGICTLCDHDMRLHVALGEYEGIIDREEVLYVPDGSPIKDIAVITRVGKPICFHILGFERGASGLTVRLSRRSAQEEGYRITSRVCAPATFYPQRSHTWKASVLLWTLAAGSPPCFR